MRMTVAWDARVGMKVSERKTVSMMLKGKFAANRCPNVRVDGKALMFVKEVRYLGISVGERMNFGVHVRGLCEKVVNVMSSLRRVMRKEWRLRRGATRIIYKELLATCVLYGVTAWYEWLCYAFVRKVLQRCERVGLYACLNVCRTVSTEAMEVLMGELPWI